MKYGLVIAFKGNRASKQTKKPFHLHLQHKHKHKARAVPTFKMISIPSNTKPIKTTTVM